MRQECAKPELRGAPGVRQVCARCEAAGHMRNRNFVINFGIATAVVSVDGGSAVLLISSSAVRIRSGALRRRSGRVYLDTTPARRDMMTVESSEARRGGERV